MGQGELMPGAEIQANAISTVLRRFPLRESPWPLDAALIALMGLAVPLIALRRTAVVAFATALVLAVVFLGAAQLGFLGGLIVPVTASLLALVLSAVGAMAVQYALAAIDREYVRLTFRRFVPEGVVDEVMKKADGARLGGVSLDSTVLFSDIRGFTSYSEGKDPTLVLNVLNRYHTEMCEAVLGNGGALISYMGDGIMAAFGVPMAQDDHADRALKAAREMVGKHLDSFNAWMRAEGHGEGFRMGVGLNSGVVTAGNIGSERRLEYTAIGDTVNTAARLEGLTKGTPHQIFLADTTRNRLSGDHEDLVLYDELEVRGRLARVKVWGVREQAVEAAVPVEAARA